MRKIFHAIAWTGTICLLMVGLWTFQCPTLPAQLATPTPTPTRPAPTPTHTPVPAPQQRWWEIDPRFPYDLLGSLTTTCPGTTGGVPVSSPPSWEYTPLPGGFGFFTKDGHTGITFTGCGASDPACANFPGNQAGWPDLLGTRTVTPTQVELGDVTVATTTQPALFWQGDLTPPVQMGSGAMLPLTASHGRFLLQTGDQVYAGFLTIIPYGQDYLEILSYTPLAEWSEYGPYFFAVLLSIGEAPAGWSAEALSDWGAGAPPTSNWGSMISMSSRGPGYSMSYPPEWEPEPLQRGEGWQVSSADGQAMVTFRPVSGDPAALLAGWQASMLTTPTIEDGEPVTLLGAEWPSRIAQGKDSSGADVTAGVAYGQIGAYVIEALWYAPAGETWDGLQETFAGILASFRVWQSEEIAPSLTMAYPAEWSSAAAPGGQGLWASAPDATMGLVVWLRGGGDAAAALAAWDGTSLTGLGLTGVTMGGESTTHILREERPTRAWSGQDSSGTAVRGAVAFVPHNDALLEIVWYAPTDRWNEAQRDIFKLHSIISSW